MSLRSEKYAVCAAKPADLELLASGMADVFSADPLISWCFPPGTPREFMDLFFKAHLLWGFEDGIVETTDNLQGCAIWLPGDSEPEDSIFEMLEILADDYPRLAIESEDGLELPSLDSEYSYLSFICAFTQNTGIGTALLTHAARELDSNGMPAYLEASSEDSSRLYKRLGFEAIGELSLPDGGPTTIPMWRYPQFGQ